MGSSILQRGLPRANLSDGLEVLHRDRNRVTCTLRLHLGRVRGAWVDISADEWHERLGPFAEHPPELPEGSPDLFSKTRTDLVFVDRETANNTDTTPSKKGDETIYLSLSTRTRRDEDENVIAIKDGIVSCVLGKPIDVAFVAATLHNQTVSTTTTTTPPSLPGATVTNVSGATPAPSQSAGSTAAPSASNHGGPPPNFNSIALPTSLSVRRLAPSVSRFDIRIAPDCTCQESPDDKKVYQVDCPPNGAWTIPPLSETTAAPTSNLQTTTLRGNIVLPQNGTAAEFINAQIVLPAEFTVTRA